MHSSKHESYIDSFNSYNSSFIGIVIFPSLLMRRCCPEKLLKIVQLVSGGDKIQWFTFVKLKSKCQTYLCMAQLRHISSIKLFQFLGSILFCCFSSSPGGWHIVAEFKLSIVHTGYLFLLWSLKKKLFHVLIFGALGLHRYALAFSCCSEQGLLSKGDTQAYCSGFSCCKAQALGHAGFNSCSLWALERGLSSCGSQGLLALRPV